MWTVEVTKAKPKLTQTEPLLTSSAVNAFQVHFIFNEDWDGLDKFAVFRAQGGEAYQVWMQDSDVVDIPWEVLVKSGVPIQVGAYGIAEDGKTIRLPTTWLRITEISQGVTEGLDIAEPTPDIYEQFIGALSKRGNRLDYFDSKLRLYADDKLLSEVPLEEAKAVSPIITVTPIANGHTITVTDANGAQTFNVMDGAKGDKGDTGAQGPKGDTGVQGPKGDTGVQGPKGEKGDTGAQGPKGDKGDKGDAGSDGKTPVKGIDYWTDEDKQAIIGDVLAVLPNGDEVSY